MVNLIGRVVLGVGVLTAAFVAGHHLAAPQSNPSGVSLATSAVDHSTSEANTVINGQSTTGAPKSNNLQSTTNLQNTSVDNEPAHKISLNKQIHLVNAAALTATGGGKVVSVTPTSWHHTAAWDVRIAQSATQYDVIVSKAQHDVLAKKLV